MKIVEYDLRKLGQQAVDFHDDLRDLISNGKYAHPIVATLPTWKADNGEMAFYANSGGAAPFYRIYVRLESSWVLFAAINSTAGSGGVPAPPVHSVQFNSGGVFGGENVFKYLASSSMLIFDQGVAFVDSSTVSLAIVLGEDNLVEGDDTTKPSATGRAPQAGARRGICIGGGNYIAQTAGGNARTILIGESNKVNRNPALKPNIAIGISNFCDNLTTGISTSGGNNIVIGQVCNFDRNDIEGCLVLANNAQVSTVALPTPQDKDLRIGGLDGNAMMVFRQAGSNQGLIEVRSDMLLNGALSVKRNVILFSDLILQSGVMVQGANSMRGVQTFFTTTAFGVASNNASEITLLRGIVGTTSLVADTLSEGRTIRLTARGYYNTALVPDALTITVKFGSVTVLTTNANTPAGAASTMGWSLNALITCQTTGGAGTVFAQGDFPHQTSATDWVSWQMTNSGTMVVNTTAANTVEITATWGGASAASQFYLTNAMGELLN